MIQPFSDFVEIGCPNCEEILEVSSPLTGRAMLCTSSCYDWQVWGRDADVYLIDEESTGKSCGMYEYKLRWDDRDDKP